jgi:hypothetical protein
VVGVQDDVARWVGGAGLVLSLASLALTWYLWQRGGPVLRVTAFVKAESASIHIEVISVGRLPATVRAIELRDQTVLNPQASRSDRTVLVRWTMPVVPLDRDGNELTLPVEDLAPTAYLQADVPIGEVITKAQGAPRISVVAMAWRGDNVVSSSGALRIR